MVITLAIRTPLTKGFKGGMKDTPLDFMVYSLLKKVLEKSNIDPQMVEDVCLGNVSLDLLSISATLTKDLRQVSDIKSAYIVRAASLAAGYPTTAAASTVNRFCSSGLKAVQDIANQISTGSIEIGVAIGAESMSATAGGSSQPFHAEIMKDQNAADCLQPMGQTSENVGKDFNISRELQDKFAAESYQRAERAQKAGWFDDEIVPFTTTIKDPKTGEEKQVTLTKDEGPRYGTTFESLSKIRPAFPTFGDRSTGGNSSQVTDGGKSPPGNILSSFESKENKPTDPLSSRRRPPHEALQSPRHEPAHPGQILRRHRRRCRPTHHGNRPLSRYPQTLVQIQPQPPNRHRPS